MAERKVKRTLKEASVALQIASGIVAIAVSFVLVLFGLKLTSPVFVPNIIFGGFVLAVIIYGAIAFFLSRKKLTAIISILISVILGGVLIFGYVTLSKSLNTFNKVTESTETEYLDVSVYVKSDSSISGITELGGLNVGYFSGDEYSSKMMEEINAVNVTAPSYEEATGRVALVDSLLNGEYSAIILNESFPDILCEQPGYETLKDDIKSIYTKNIEVEREQQPVAANPSTGSNGQGGEEDSVAEDIPTIELKEVYSLSEDEDIFTIYISGIDKWGSIYTRSRSDVNIIAVVNAKNGKIQLINTPRDYYVYLPVQGAYDKLTHAGLYGIDSSKAALEQLYGVKIDYYVRMNFSGFEKIIDSVGGIDVYSEYDFTVEPIKHYTVGYNHLTGLEALAFARERYAFAAGDVQRGNNQMAVIRGVIDKLTSPSVLIHLDQVLDGLEDTVSTDLPADMIYNLASYQFTTGKEWQINNYTVTGKGESLTTYSMPDMPCYVMIPNEGTVSEAVRLMESVLSE